MAANVARLPARYRFKGSRVTHPPSASQDPGDRAEDPRNTVMLLDRHAKLRRHELGHRAEYRELFENILRRAGHGSFVESTRNRCCRSSQSLRTRCFAVLSQAPRWT